MLFSVQKSMNGEKEKWLYFVLSHFSPSGKYYMKAIYVREWRLLFILQTEEIPAQRDSLTPL